MDSNAELSEKARKTLYELLEYAESLGIVETLQLDDVEADTKTTTKSTSEQKYYKYLIVVDFESTCWNDKTAKTRKPEIIGKNNIPADYGFFDVMISIFSFYFSRISSNIDGC